MTIIPETIFSDACGVLPPPPKQVMPIMQLKYSSNTREAAAEVCMHVVLERQFPTGLVVYTRISPLAPICPQLAAFIRVASCQCSLTLSRLVHSRLGCHAQYVWQDGHGLQTSIRIKRFGPGLRRASES